MGLAAFPDVALRDAAILGLHCCCKEMSNVTKVAGVISDDAGVNLAADILTPRMPFANNPPLNSSHRWLLASPFFSMWGNWVTAVGLPSLTPQFVWAKVWRLCFGLCPAVCSWAAVAGEGMRWSQPGRMFWDLYGDLRWGGRSWSSLLRVQRQRAASLALLLLLPCA